MTHPRQELFGLPVDALTMKETLERVEQFVETGAVAQQASLNVAKLVMARRDEKVRAALNACDLVNADGQGIVWAGRILRVPIPERVPGIDLFQQLVARAHSRGYSIYLLGATEEVIRATVERLRTLHPGLRVAGFRNGYFSDREEQGVVEAIRRAQPDFLFVGMSSPRKELFLHAHFKELGVPFVMGVGGSLDIIAGKTRRAPAWMQRAGLEWLFRLCLEPRRMWRRYLWTNAVFLGLIAKTLVAKTFRRASREALLPTEKKPGAPGA